MYVLLTEEMNLKDHSYCVAVKTSNCIAFSEKSLDYDNKY